MREYIIFIVNYSYAHSDRCYSTNSDQIQRIILLFIKIFAYSRMIIFWG